MKSGKLNFLEPSGPLQACKGLLSTGTTKKLPFGVNTMILLLLLQMALQPLVGFRPAQLSLSILSRKVFTECLCQRHVKPPTWRRTRDLERSNFRHKRPQRLKRRKRSQQRKAELWARNGRENFATSTSLLGSFTCRKARHETDGFTSPPKEGVLRIFSPEKSNGFGWVWTRELGYHATSRPPKPLIKRLNTQNIRATSDNTGTLLSRNTPPQMPLLSDVDVIFFFNPILVLIPKEQFLGCATVVFGERYVT
jgi:hypothetical protein